MTDLYTGGTYLHRLDSELFEFGYSGALQELRVEDYEETYGINPETAILSTLALCNSIINYGSITPKETEPVFELTERTVEYALRHDRIEPSQDLNLDDHACLEAEPRLLRSLAWHDGPEASRLGARNNTKPAAIFFDSMGEPFAYQKASGLSTAYVWRSCTIDLQHARYHLPADCFITLTYPPAEDPRLLYQEHSLVAFEAIPQQASVDLLRFSTFGLANTVRLEGARTTVERAEKLSEQLPLIARTSPYSIGERVQQLLKGGHALSVRNNY